MAQSNIFYTIFSKVNFTFLSLRKKKPILLVTPLSQCCPLFALNDFACMVLPTCVIYHISWLAFSLSIEFSRGMPVTALSSTPFLFL